MIRQQGPFARRGRRAAMVLCCGAMAAALPASSATKTETPASADPERLREKAAVVFELTRFVEWAPKDLAAPGSEFVIGVLGDEAFGAEIRREVAGQAVGGRAIRTKSFRNLDEVEPCAILVVGRAKSPMLPAVLDFLADAHGVLTVGESADFAELGGGVGLLEFPDRIGFEINREAARRADLKLSTQILRLAERLLPPQADGKSGP